MNDHSNEKKWVELYQAALIELQDSLLGRIMEARAEIVIRVEKLRTMPGLHADERQAIEDALSSLRFLKREQVKHAADQQRAAAQTALEKLNSIAPTVQRFSSKSQQ